MEKNIKVVFTEKSKVELWETEIPEPGPGEVLIKTIVSQISTGTELTMLEANVDSDSNWHKMICFPNYPGYSNVGKVVKIGKDVDESWLGKRVLSVANHEKYAIRDVELLYPVPEEIDSEEVVFGTVAPVAWASIRTSGIRPGDTVVVYGAGLIGQLVARFAKIAGAGNIFVTDVSDYRLDMLPDMPAFIKVNTTKEDILDALSKYGNKEKARIVFETTSVPALIEPQLKCLQKLGRLIITSSPKGKALVDFDYCSHQGLTIIGAHNWAIHTPIATPYDPWTKAADVMYYLDLVSKKELSLKSLITHRENYRNAPAVYEMLMKDRTQALGVLLVWED